MKVIFVNRFFWPDLSATSQMVTDLAKFLAGRGVEVHVLASRMHHDRPAERLDPSAEVEGVKIHRIWTTRFGRGNLAGRLADYISFYPSALWTLARLARRGDIIVAKTDPPLISVVAAIACRLRGARLVNWLQDVFPEAAERMGIRAARGALGGLLRRARDFSLRAASVNVVLGTRMEQFVKMRTDRTVLVIHNWADGELIRPRSAQAHPLREKWGLTEHFVVGYSGNMGRAHDLMPLLDAAQRLATVANIAFLFVGAGKQLVALKDECARRSLANVHFQPFQPQEALPLSLTVPDVHFVSLNPGLEGLIVPSKFYAALAAGKPVIFCGDADGELAREIRSFGDCGLVVAPEGDVIANAIGLLARDVEATRRMGQRARQLFDERFAQPIALERWLLLIERANGQLEAAVR
jgi:glycosyltransferase involved in cell wall biosynthesis